MKPTSSRVSNRRQFLKTTGIAAAATAATAGTVLANRVPQEEKKQEESTPPSETTQEEGTDPAASDQESESAEFIPNRIAISTYSFWRYRDDSKFTIPRCIDLSARMGFDAVEILKVQMEDESPGYLQQLKQRAFSNGIDLCGMSTHQGFVTPDADERKKNVEETIGFIELSLIHI